MKRAFLGLGGFQVVVCTAVAYALEVYLGLPPKTAFVAAGALSLSSTALVVKQLAEQNELHTVHGRLSISILLFQDLAAVLFLILIPALASNSAAGAESNLATPILFAVLKGVAVCLILGMAGQWLLRPLFHTVAKAHSNELFMLAALLVALSAAYITHKLDLSMALGAFLAGLMLGETEFRHQIEIDIRPFRDVLLGLFFITVGALLQLSELSKPSEAKELSTAPTDHLMEVPIEILQALQAFEDLNEDVRMTTEEERTQKQEEDQGNAQQAQTQQQEEGEEQQAESLEEPKVKRRKLS